MKQYGSFGEYLQAKYPRGPYMATDILIRLPEQSNKVVLIERKYHPTGLAIPGGMYELGLTLEQNALKEAKEETGLDILLDSPFLPRVLSHPNQDPRAHIVSVLYTARGFGDLAPHPDEDAKSAGLFSVRDLTDLVQSDAFVMPHHKDHVAWYVSQHTDLVRRYG